MSGLVFLVLRGAKNSLLELRRKPGKLVPYIIVLLTMAGALALNLLSPADAGDAAGVYDVLYLKGILFAFFLLSFITAVITGFSQGSALFGMEDVNLLFVSPVNPRAILIYGIFRTVKTLALSSIFILVYGANLFRFGVGAGGLGVLYAGYLLTAVVSQLLSLLIYSATNGNKNRQRLVKALIVFLFTPLAAVAAGQLYASGGDFLAALRGILDSPVFSYTPVAGWAAEGVVALMTGQGGAGVLFCGLLLLAGAGSVAVIYIGRPDYYEDALVATETLFERRRSLAEGQVNSVEQLSKRRVRVRGTGVGGQGASALFYKHARESFRANRFGLWGVSTVLLVAGAAVYTWVMRQSTGEAGTAPMLATLGTLMWVQIFMVGTGRGLKETYSHYIYMIPERPFQKMVWGNAEVMLKAAVEGALICAASGLAAGAGAAVTVAAAVAYTLFVFMLVAVNFVSLRFTGTDISAGLLITLYMFGVVLLMVPGIVLAVVTGVLLGVPAGLVVLAGWELLLALGGFWAARGVLHDCDMAVLRQPGSGREG